MAQRAKGEVLPLKDESFQDRQRDKMKEAMKDKTSPVKIIRHGSGLSVYFKKEVVKHFKKQDTMEEKLLRLRILQEEIESTCFVVRSREEVSFLMNEKEFDIPPDAYPIIIIRPILSNQVESGHES